MKNEIKDYKDFLQRISDEIHFFCKDFFPDDFVLACQITLKFALLTLLVFVVSFILKNGINLVFRFFFIKRNIL